MAHTGPPAIVRRRAQFARRAAQTAHRAEHRPAFAALAALAFSAAFSAACAARPGVAPAATTPRAEQTLAPQVRGDTAAASSTTTTTTTTTTTAGTTGITALATAPSASPAAAPAPVDLDAESTEMLRWFDSFGVPDVAGLPFVRVTPRPLQRAGGLSLPGSDTPRVGFVLEQSRERLVVLFDIEPVEFPRAPGDPLPRVEPLDLGAHLRAFIAEGSANDNGRRWPVVHPPFRSHTSGALECFWRARAAARFGLGTEAAALVALTRAELAALARLGEHAPHLLGPALRTDIARLLLWDGIIALGVPGTTRAALRERFARAAALEDGGRFAQRAAELTQALDSLLIDERAHVEPESGAADAARIEDWVYHLRDQARSPEALPQPATLAGTEVEPSVRLVAAGAAAVPALLAVVDDTRPSRELRPGEPDREVTGVFDRVRSVGELALGTLERIAGTSFDDPAAAAAWWRTAHQNGEFAATLDVVQHHTEPYQTRFVAQHLLELSRPRGLRELTALARHASDRRLREEALAALADDTGREQLPLLRERLTRGASRGERVVAAEGLARRGVGAWLAPMITELARAVTETASGASGDEQSAARELIELLLSRGGARGAAAVQAQLPRMSEELREDVADYYHRHPEAAPPR